MRIATRLITNGKSAKINDSNCESGTIYVYKQTEYNWAQIIYIKACDNRDGNKFGYSVSLESVHSRLEPLKRTATRQQSLTVHVRATTQVAPIPGQLMSLRWNNLKKLTFYSRRG